MYITVKTIKRNFGFNGIEINDVLIGLPIFMLFVILFCFTSHKIFSIVTLMFGVFCLIPINISKKNRVYKILGLIVKYLIKDKISIYQEERQVSKV